MSAESTSLVWAPFRRSYRKAIGVVRAHVETLFEPSVLASRDWSIKQALEGLPWDKYESTMLTQWERGAAVMLARTRAAERDALAPQVSVSKAGATTAAEFDMADVSLADQLAVEWLETRGLALVQGQTRKAKEAMRAVFQQGVAEGWTVPRLVREIRDQVGMHPQDQAALSRFRSRLLAKDATRVQRKVQAYQTRLVKRRAELIARTEIRSAVENGKLFAWQEMQASGELSLGVLRMWDAGPGCCPLCAELAANGPIPIGKLFNSNGRFFNAPGAHPNCNCQLRLVWPGLKPSRIPSRSL